MTFETLTDAHDIFLQTKASSSNELGEWEYTYTIATTATRCRMSPLSAKERTDQSGRFDDVRYKCFVPSSVNLQRDQRLEFRGETYQIKEVILDSSSHHKTGYVVLL